MNKSFIGAERLDLESNKIVELKYFILEETKIIEETGDSKKTYGIEIEKWSESNVEKDFVNDITTEKEYALNITNCLIENKITPVHLKDVIVDML